MSDLPARITLSRAKGWRLQDVAPGAVKVDRTTIWGNPFTIQDAREAGYKGDDAALADMCVRSFEQWLQRPHFWTGPESERRRAAILSALPTLRGKPLACWCKPGRPCHADILLRLANA